MDNMEKLKELVDFFESEDRNTCLLQGQAGSFKSALFNKACEHLDENVLCFRIKCFESTTLDDIFLSLFETLKNYSHKKKLKFAKIETNSISQRINSYLNGIDHRAVILLDSLENVFEKKNKIEKEEILNFIEHLHSMRKFKIVLISEYFDKNVLSLLFATEINISPYSKKETGDHLFRLKIDFSNETLEEFYEITKGNPYHIFVSANIVTTLKTSLDGLLWEFRTKNVSFEEYILQKLLTFVVEKAKKSLRYLALLNGGISKEFLEKRGFLTKEQLSYMCEKGLLAEEDGVVFLKDFLKKYLKKNIPIFEKIKIHKFWKEFYEQELPKKPANRTILISRNTMRNQIDYHNSFLSENSAEKINPQKANEKTDLNLMSYLNSNLTDWNIKNTNTETQGPDGLKKGSAMEKYALTKDEVSLLNHPIDLEKSLQKKGVEEARLKIEKLEKAEKEQQEKKQKLSEILFSANALEQAHSFDAAYGLYLSALELREDSEFSFNHPQILQKLALCAKKTNHTTAALDWLNRLVNLYESQNETEKMNLTRLEIAKIYKESYKIGHAKVIYAHFINKNENVSDTILLHSYLALAQLEEDSANHEKALEYYQKAFEKELPQTRNEEETEALTQALAEAYFKYALILDDSYETDNAFEFYEKCVKISKKPVIYTSWAYTNMAEIITERNYAGKMSDYEKALKHLKSGLKADLALSNFEGIYYICLKIAEIYAKTDPKQVKDSLLKALSAAKRTGQKDFIKSAYLELAQHYRKENDIKKAEKAQALAEGIKDE